MQSNRTKVSSLALAAMALGAGIFSSCSNEDLSGSGEGYLALRMQVNTTLKRSTPDNEQELRDNCTVYLSSSKGLIYKWQGAEQVPQRLPLKTGNYVAEAWAGDSVSASFDKKFYRGYQPFEIHQGDTEQVTVNCAIANVVTGVRADASIAEALQSYTLTVGHSRGELQFTNDMDESVRGYFMMPNADTSLTWKLEGEDLAGQPVVKQGVIEGVQRAHEYMLNLSFTPGESEPFGAAYLQVTIDDTCLLIEDVVTITGAPQIQGVGYDLASGLTGEPGKWERHSVYVQALGTLTSLALHTDHASALGLPSADLDFLAMDATQRAQISAAGLTCEYAAQGESSTARIFLEAAMLNRLAEGEYQMQITALDSNGKKRVRTLTIQVTDADVKLTETTWQEVYAYSATLHGVVTKEGAEDLGFRYRKFGEQAWTSVTATPDARSASQGSAFSATLSGLQGGTKYEYQAVSRQGANTSSMTFTTETAAQLPNSSFENWGMSGKTVLLYGDGQQMYWDSGNWGSSTMSVNITDKSTDMVHSGTYSAKLVSQFVGVMGIGKFAAGNLFIGKYLKTDGTDGVLGWGRAFNSRPKALKVWVKYVPGTVTSKGAVSGLLNEGDQDQGAIYIALTDGSTQEYGGEKWPVVVKTKSSERQLFDPEGQNVIAYGSKFFTAATPGDGLMEVTIPLDYRRNDVRVANILLVASASRYGDFFCGGEKSTMWIDDVELLY